MMYSDKIRLATKIAFEAHFADEDKGGYPYIMHPLHIAEKMNMEDGVIVALLHDVVEDHPDRYSFDDFRRLGFSETVVTALECITKRDGEPYMDYIKRVSTNELASVIKLYDLEHNMMQTRCKIGDKLMSRYKEAMRYLIFNT